MLDRMFLAEEQQSLIKLRQELEETPNLLEPTISQTQSESLVHKPTATQMQSTATIPSAPTSTQSHSVELTSEEYDEWACIQRELGCLPPDDFKPNISAPKRSASSDSRLESLKKFRVDKQKKNTDIVNNSVNVSVRSQNSPQNFVQVSQNNVLHRTQLHHNVTGTNAQFIHSSQHMQSQQMAQITQSSTHNVHFSHSTQHIVQHFTHTVHHNVHSNASGQSVYNTSVHNYQGDATDEDTTQNNSIDEQVQSAIDSILNLQQNTNIDLDDAVSSILS